MTLFDSCEAVYNAKTFLEFVRELQRDREAEVKNERTISSSSWDSGTNGWENGSIESFLDASASWAEESDDFNSTANDSASWNLFAKFLYMGKTYE